MRYIPRRPTGDSPSALFFQAVWDKLWGGEMRLHNIPGQIDFNYTPKGIYPTVKLRPGGGPAPAKSDYAGVYVPGQSYDAFEWVVMQGGAASGAYISTADGNTNAPTTGLNWVQFSALPQWF